MQCACDFYARGNLPGRLKFAETLIACGDNLGKVLVERQSADIGQEGLQD